MTVVLRSSQHVNITKYLPVFTRKKNMAANQREQSAPLSEVADNFFNVRVANQLNLQEMEQLFLELKEKSVDYRNRCESEKAKYKHLKAAFAQMYSEYHKKDEVIAKLKKELGEAKAQLERNRCKKERMKQHLKTIYTDLVANSDDESEQPATAPQ